MNKILIFCVAFVLVMSSVVFSATINVRVETDKTSYKVGDTVSWTIFAWASQEDNRGVALLSVDLDDDTGETLLAPLTSPTGTEFMDTNYGDDELFMMLGSGLPSISQSRLVDIMVAQLPILDILLDVGNDGDPNLILAKGSYTATVLGPHLLNAEFNVADYWPDDINNAVEFENYILAPASFTVMLNSDINKDYYVNMQDFARIALQWQQGGCNETSDCNGADLNRNGIVDLEDLAGFATEWLSCTDPSNSDCEMYWMF